MKLIKDQLLEKSSVVANCCMNRERGLSGTNGYDKELRIDPLALLRTCESSHENVMWLDLCCGTGKALIEAAAILDSENATIGMVGVDLAGLFLPSESKRLQLTQASLTGWQPRGTFDLVTCVHGLHYIGDKLDLLSRARAWLKAKGRFVANLDLNNLKLDGADSPRSIVAALRRAGFDYFSRHNLLQCEGQQEDCFPLEYLGADDQAGANYTGQPAVDSYYRKIDS